MSLIGLVRQAINGQATWTDVENKVTSLAENGALDVLEAAESFATAFLSKFAPAEAQSAGAAVLAVATGTSASAAGSTLLQQTETNAETAAEGALTPTPASPAPAAGS